MYGASSVEPNLIESPPVSPLIAPQPIFNVNYFYSTLALRCVLSACAGAILFIHARDSQCGRVQAKDGRREKPSFAFSSAGVEGGMMDLCLIISLNYHKDNRTHP